MDKKLMELHTAFNKHVWAPQAIYNDYFQPIRLDKHSDLLRCGCGAYALSLNAVLYGNNCRAKEPLHGAMCSYAKRLTSKEALKDLIAYSKLFRTDDRIDRYVMPLLRLLRGTAPIQENAHTSFLGMGKNHARVLSKILREYKETKV